MSRVVTADARKVSRADFYAAVTGRPRLTEAQKSERRERDQAWTECEKALCIRQPTYREQREHDERCYAAFAEKLAEIDEKYALTPVEHGTDPGTGRPRVAA